MLSLSDEELVKMQLNRAVKMNDPARIISREIALKKIYLEAHATSFELSRCLRGLYPVPCTLYHATSFELSRCIARLPERPVPCNLYLIPCHVL